jgi:hypothetical protein
MPPPTVAWARTANISHLSNCMFIIIHSFVSFFRPKNRWSRFIESIRFC